MALIAPTTGNLTRWAEQGILLLNATLTVRAHKPVLTKNEGGKHFTDAAIRILAEEIRASCIYSLGSLRQRKGHSST